MLHNKAYKQTLRIIKTIFLAATTIRRTNLRVTLSAHCLLLIEIWTPTPLAAAHVNSWSNFLHSTTCSGGPDWKLWISKSKRKSSYWSNKALKLRSSAHQKCVTNFFLLQAGGTWYVLKHTPNDVENALDCVSITYGPPEGGISLITKHANVTRWVCNIHCLFTAILSR